MNTKRIRTFAVLTALLAATPLMKTSGTAEARTTSGKCTVTPYAPAAIGTDAANRPKMNSQFKVDCEGLRTVTVRQRIFEADAGDDQLIVNSRYWTRDFFFPGSKVIDSVDLVPDTEASDEEMYQAVSFRVTTGGVTSPWTAWESSPIRTIHN